MNSFSLLLLSLHHVVGRGALTDKNGALLALTAPYNAQGVSRIDRVRGLSARCMPPVVAFEPPVVHLAPAAMGRRLRPCPLSRLLLNME